MTDEELEKRAERYARNSLSTLADTVIQDNVKLAYIKGAKEGNQLKERLDLNEKKKMLVKIFDLKKSDIFNYYIAEYSHVKEIKHIGFNIELVLQNNSKVGYRTDLYGAYVEVCGENERTEGKD